MFADDTNMILSHTDLHTLIYNTNEEMMRISKWFQLNKLALNIKKSNFIIFAGRGRKYFKDYIKVSVDGNEIFQVSHTHFLGILVDEKLNWKNHIHFIHNKTVKSLSIISKLRNLINVPCLLTLYYSMIYLYLIYVNIVWANTYPSSLHQLYLMQKQFVRLATFSNSMEASAPLFRKLKIFQYMT